MIKIIKHILTICFLSVFIYAQTPTDLNQNESYIHNINLDSDGEYLLYINLSSNTSWEEENNESAVLTVFIDGIYNQDIIIYNGSEEHTYKQALGFLNTGEHSLQFYFDYNKSSSLASNIHIETITIINSNTLNIDEDVFKYSPILYGRNIFAWNESNHTDIPLLMYHDIQFTIEAEPGQEQISTKRITYHIIFSNEDSRVGIGLSDMMLSWGRTTDIEWIYEVTLNQFNGEIIDEVFQAASHTTTEFNGQKLDTHPYLINATANCNFSDAGTSDYIFFLSPEYYPNSNGTRENLMDQNPWTYKIMSQELINENKYEEIQDPTHWEISDTRNYLYIEFSGWGPEGNNISNVSTSFYNDCYIYSNNHNDENIEYSFDTGFGENQRTAIELPENFNPQDLQYLYFSTNLATYYLTEINSMFYLSENYIPIYIGDNIETPNYQADENNPISITINNDILNIDCNEEENGSAFCDQCGICSGGNTDINPNQDLDNCGVCFGNNEAMDCNGECFGNAYIDDCGVCDNNFDNDGSSCISGCFDANAENYNPDAVIFDNSCIYSDRIFHVPSEYNQIGSAVFFASNQDTVLVAPGTYYEEIDFAGKSIKMISTHGPDSTIIIANYGNEVSDTSESVITIRDVTNDTAILDGFTLQGGHGKGVDFEYFISVASDAFMFNDMMYNYIKSGAVTSINSSISLNNLIIKNNTATNFGAGVGLVDSYSNITNVLFENNHIPDGNALGGGAIAVNGGTTSIDNCIIKNNSVGLNFYQLNGGAGILCGFNFSDTPLELSVSNTEIFNNSANIGAAIGTLSGNIILDRLLIYNNTGNYGSAISMGEPLGLVVGDINMTIIQSTIADNNGTFSFGLTDNSHLLIANSILWNENGVYEFLSLPNNSILDINAFYSDIRLIDNVNHSNSITSNPLFTESNNYNLSSSSPCIDTGTNSLIFNEELIIDSESYQYNGNMPDMGYFEFSYLNGDINSDSMVNIFDVVLLVNIIIGDTSIDEYDIEIIDLNQDQIINVIDIIALINIILSI